MHESHNGPIDIDAGIFVSVNYLTGKAGVSLYQIYRTKIGDSISYHTGVRMRIPEYDMHVMRVELTGFQGMIHYEGVQGLLFDRVEKL